MKIGMSRTDVQSALSHQISFGSIASIPFKPPVLAGLIVYGLGSIVWLLVLAKTDVSKAYPFLALGLCLTVVLAHLFLGEPLGLKQILGTFVVCVGIGLIVNS
jgi:drug/metabolite transporter (DMT)-like permease